MKMTALSRSSMVRAREELEAAGLVKLARGGGRHSTGYELPYLRRAKKFGKPNVRMRELRVVSA